MFHVIKRDGEVADFTLVKINDAIIKAFQATDMQYTNDIVDLLALRVTAEFQGKVRDGRVHVEDIQDSVEKVLEQAGYAETAKAFILYRKQREKMRNMKSTILDYKDVVNSYVKVEDWRVKENSTVTYSVGGLILSNSGAVTANYWLSEIYDNEIAEAHRNADIHIHDLSMLTGYCAGWSLKQLIQEGLGGITGKITSAPAAHLSIFKIHLPAAHDRRQFRQIIRHGPIQGNIGKRSLCPPPAGRIHAINKRFNTFFHFRVSPILIRIWNQGMCAACAADCGWI